jgi:Putative zinc-finger
MRYLTCDEARELLPAYCDRELSLDDQLAMGAHLAWCEECAAEIEALDSVGDVLRGVSTVRLETVGDDLISLRNRVLARAQAERDESLPRRAERLLDDLHVVWAAAGATLATAVCLAALLGFVRLSLREAPQSMAAIIGAMADPGSNRNPISLDNRMLRPRLYPDVPMPPVLTRPDAVLAFSAVVTREGQVRNLALLGPDEGLEAGDRALMELLDTVSQTRFEPARARGAPVAVNVVWLMAHTTVVGKEGIELIHRTPSWHPVRRMPLPPATPPAGGPISRSGPAGETVAA